MPASRAVTVPEPAGRSRWRSASSANSSSKVFMRHSRLPAAASRLRLRSAAGKPPRMQPVESPHRLRTTRAEPEPRVVLERSVHLAVDEHPSRTGDAGEPAGDVDRRTVDVAESGDHLSAGEPGAQIRQLGMLRRAFEKLEGDLRS